MPHLITQSTLHCLHWTVGMLCHWPTKVRQFLLCQALLVILCQNPGVLGTVPANLQVPGVDGFGLNVSIGSMTSSPQSDFQAKMTFPLFVGGEQQVQGKWVGNGSLPAGMTDQYTDDQLQLLCISEVNPPGSRSSATRLTKLLHGRTSLHHCSHLLLQPVQP